MIHHLAIIQPLAEQLWALHVRQKTICCLYYGKTLNHINIQTEKNEYLFIHDYPDNVKTASAIFRGVGSGRLISKLIDRSVYFEYD